MKIEFKHEKGTPRSARSATIKFGKQATGFIQAEIVVSPRKDKAGKYDGAIAIQSLTMGYVTESYVERDEAEDAALFLTAEKLFALSATAEQMALELQARVQG